MNRPKVSVVVPVYNTEKYLERCLDSLLNQTLQDIEIIVIDDGSQDNCPHILDEYQKRHLNRMKVIHKTNGGQATARNLAFQYCIGEYIGFVDSDDFVKPDMFEKMYSEACKKNADYVACGYTDFYLENDKEVILKRYTASRPAKETKDLFIGALAPPWLHIYKRELIVDNNIRFPEGVIYEDTALYLNLIPYIKRIAIVEEALYVRLRRVNSTMTTFTREKVDDIFSVFRYSLEFYRNNGFEEAYKSELEYFCVRVLLCSSMQRISRVKKYKDSRILLKQTLCFIRDFFPNYKSNPYFKKGKVSLYMKSINKVTAPMVLILLRLTNHFKRSYS